MAEVHISLVKYDDFTGLDSGTHFPRTLGIVVPGSVHNGKAGQETLQIQPQMTLGRRLAPPMFGPVHAGSNQRDGGRVHQMNHALELTGKSLPVRATDEARGQLAQVFKDGPEKFL